MENTLRKTKALLNKYNLTANKRFGQNFLVDDNILDKIVEVSDIKNNDLIIEIGPGLGNLTEYLLDNSRFALLVEIDNNMIKVLNDRFKDRTNFMLINQDILMLDIDKKISEIEKKLNHKFDDVKVIANLPYYITSPIIFKLLEDSKRITRINVMVQKEVADRIISKNKCKDFGVLTVMIDLVADASIKINVPRECFVPSPNVDSAVVSIIKNKKYDIKDMDLLKKLVKASFTNRRKKLLNSLEAAKFLNLNKNEYIEILNKNEISSNVRAEELQVEDFVKISNYIYENYQ